MKNMRTKGKNKKKLKKLLENRKSLAVVGVVVFIIISALVIQNKNIIGSFLGIGKKPQNSTSSSVLVNINYNNIEKVMSSNSIVADLPEDSLILLRFYNFNSGERQWEKSYVITKASVGEGVIDKQDITVVLHSKYLEKLTNRNFCTVIKEAKANGDLAFSLEISKAKFLWKYKGMFKHQECFGF